MRTTLELVEELRWAEFDDDFVSPVIAAASRRSHIWLHSAGRSFLTDWRIMEIPGIVVRICPQRIKIKVVVDSREKAVNVDPDNMIGFQELENQ